MPSTGVTTDFLSLLAGFIKPWTGFNRLGLVSLGFIACLFAGRQIKKWHAQKNLPPLPPGPKTSLFKGPAMGDRASWLVYTEWQKEFGDLVYYSYLGNKILILNNYEDFVELYDKRGKNYSSRTHRTMVEDVLGFEFMFTTMADDENWRLHRSLFHKYFGHGEQRTYTAAQTAHIHSYLRSLLREPEKFRYNSRRAAAGVVLSLLYGYNVSMQNDRYVFLADESLKAIVDAGAFGTYMVDYIPFLRFVPTWFPWTGWKRQAMAKRKLIKEALDTPFKQAKSMLEAGIVEDCLVKAELGSSTKNKRPAERIVKNTAATAFMAGSDTTVSLTSSFWLVCTKFPDIQRRAQEEVDRVCPDRLPELSDRPKMPLVQSMIYELLRWNPATPVGIPHYVKETDVYKGFTIPAGTGVIANMWLMLHDEKVYPDPFEFKIDRFLKEDGTVLTPVEKRKINPLPDCAVFGVGKRRCPGNYIALDFLFLMVTHLLKTFQVSRSIVDGKEYDPPAKYSSGLGSSPLEFSCVIRPRSAEAIDLIESTPRMPDSEMMPPQ